MTDRRATFAAGGLLSLAALAAGAPLLASSQPFLFHAPGLGWGSPWLSGLFDQNTYESSLDRGFNALLLLGPFALAAWLLLRPRIARAGRLVLLALAALVLIFPLFAGTSMPSRDYHALAQAPGSVAIFPPIPRGFREVDLANIRAAPSPQHLLGTDNAGRDVLVRLIYGTRISLTVGLFSVALYVTLGTLIGALAGFLGGKVDLFLGRIIEVVLSIPSLFLILTAAAFIEHRSVFHVLAIIALVQWTTPARLVRAELLRLRSAAFVDAARALGFSEARILFRELLPNAIAPVFVTATFGVGSAILIEATMSFLGLGDITVPSWGQILNAGRTTGSWPMILAPGLAIFVTVGLLNLLGDALRDAFDPRLRQAERPHPLPSSVADRAPPDPQLLLEVRELSVAIGEAKVVERLSFAVKPGQAVGVVGESGSGKTLAALALLRLLPDPPARVVGGVAYFRGKDLLSLEAAALRQVRGKEIALVFQEPLTALDPVYTVGEQIEEAIVTHEEAEPEALRSRAIALLSALGVPSAELRVDEYPHRLSGGLRQRALIATALAANPRLLIADEPTTALDVTIQAQILDLLSEERRRRDMALLLITHDLALVKEACDAVVVMYAGRAVERGPVARVLAAPLHPYTVLLLLARPTAAAEPGSPLPTIPGVVPSPSELPSGCPFRNRCPSADERCAAEPPLVFDGPEHVAYCFHPAERRS